MSERKGNSVEETNSGVKKRGNWKEIAEFGEEIEDVLEDPDSISVEKFSEWRPKIEESEKDVKRKTVDEAVTKEKVLEEQSDGIKEDFKQASGEMKKASKKAAKKEMPEDEIMKASEKAAKPFYSKLARIIREIESKIYLWLTLRFNPYYLDTQDFSADIKDKKNGQFEMSISVLEEDKRKELKENFRDGD